MKLWNLTLILLLMGTQNNLSGNTPLDQLEEWKWEHRLILYVIPPEEGDYLSSFLQAIEEHKVKLVERDIRFIDLRDGDFNLPLHLPLGDVPREKLVIHLDQAIFQKGFALVGKDGEIKAKADDIFEVDFFINLIDRMPMRQSEMRRSQKKLP